MKTRVTLFCVAAAAMLLAACGEKSQDLRGASGVAAPAYGGTGVASFTAPGWKAGDAQSWSQELRARGQYGQNEYTRIINK
jgi:hypothetical protein